MVVAAAAGGTIATVEEAAIAAAEEAGNGLACDSSATENWMLGRRVGAMSLLGDLLFDQETPRLFPACL